MSSSGGRVGAVTDRVGALTIGLAVFFTITSLVERLRVAERALLAHDLGAGASQGARAIFVAVREQQEATDDA